MSKTRCNNTLLKQRELKIKLKRFDTELEGLQLISCVLQESSGQEIMLQDVVNLLDAHFGFVRSTIMLVSPDGNELQVESYTKDSPANVAASYNRGEGITGKVLQTGQPAVIPKISQSSEFSGKIHRRDDDQREMSFICVPVIVGQKTVGTLSADLPCKDEYPLDEAQRILTIIASLIANDVKARRKSRIEKRRLKEENLRLRDELQGLERPGNIIGSSRSMRRVYRQIYQVAPSDTTVLIRGESGTGKELVASAVHYNSIRNERHLIKVNCAALNENILESELFGHEKGAFTGAISSRTGRIEEAQGGTLFLDEIGDFSPAIQVKLLRVLQEREYERVGSNETRQAHVRIICATNCNLEQAVENGTFRQDLYYRINVFPITLPPLRKRKEDIILLAEFFLDKIAQRIKKKIPRLSSSATKMMLNYDWPGNVRELENCMEHAILLTDDNIIRGYHLPPHLQQLNVDEGNKTGTLKAHVQMLERDMITDALRRNGGSVSAAAKQLGLTARMIRYKIHNLSIKYQPYKRKPVEHSKAS